MNRVNVWDGWRGMAIILLLSGHFVRAPWIWEDRMGVDFFFVLSGMLMSTILFEKRMNLKQFYIRRFSRIMPAFTLFVLVSFAAAALAGWAFETKEVIANLTFLRTYYPLEPHIWDTNVPVQHLWSLNVEEHAYIIMSLMTLFLFRNTHVAYVLIALGLISIGICFYYYLNPASAPTQFRIRTESAISFIFLSAGYNLIRKRWHITVPPILPIITLLIAVVCYLKAMPDWLTFSLSPLLLAFTLNHLLEASKAFRSLLELKFIRLMGLWSFSIYLWQQPFYYYAQYVPGPKIVAMIPAIIIGALSFYLFENPVRSWINKRWGGSTPPSSNQVKN